jgi:hypothetical protein
MDKEHQTEYKEAQWEPPEEGWLKINVDGAFDCRIGEGRI